MNKVILVGNLTKDIELRKTQSNKSVCQFSLAINEGKDKVEFVDCRSWEKTAELLNQYTSKGSKILVEGKIKTESFETQTGKVKRTFVEVYNLEFVQPKATPNVSTSTDTNLESSTRTHSNDTIYTQNVNIDADELPFY